MRDISYTVNDTLGIKEEKEEGRPEDSGRKEVVVPRNGGGLEEPLSLLDTYIGDDS